MRKSDASAIVTRGGRASLESKGSHFNFFAAPLGAATHVLSSSFAKLPSAAGAISLLHFQLISCLPSSPFLPLHTTTTLYLREKANASYTPTSVLPPPRLDQRPPPPHASALAGSASSQQTASPPDLLTLLELNTSLLDPGTYHLFASQ